METSVRCASHQWLLARKARETSTAAAGSQSVFIQWTHVYDKNCEKGQGFTINYRRPPYRANVPITQWNNEFIFQLEIQYHNYCKDKQPTNDWLLSCFKWSGTGAVVAVSESLNYKWSSFAYNASWNHSVAFLSCMWIVLSYCQTKCIFSKGEGFQRDSLFSDCAFQVFLSQDHNLTT